MTSDVVVLEPVVSWPHEVELGRSYVVTVDIRPAEGSGPGHTTKSNSN